MRRLAARQILVAVALLAGSGEVSSPVRAADPFKEYVRTTDPLSPEQQLKTFHLPPGFTIELLAAEPDVAKPMNLAVDARGRLWVSETRQYPFPAKPDQPKKDAIKILEDTDGDGRADRIVTFVDNLDIPVGLLPLGDGSSVIAYDINSICLYVDTDNDGKADRREVLYTGFGFVEDTHGMASNFRRGFDGWVYGCHGFKNKSEVRDRNGNVTKLESGNTYRFKLDGSKFEMVSIGQINPFGMTFDPLGNLYTSDSHSKPIYQILRGGRYEAFDRNTDDGLGLAPRVMDHLHGSTAIAGSLFYAAEAFPEEFRGNVFVGNVITCRINRDRLEYVGSTPRAIEEPDFLRSDDPWFRPVNLVMGPDGAIYVADFYNRIIGHYEVKLDHPGRDYERGRIWKISFAAKDAKDERFDLVSATAEQLVERLDDPNLTVRMLAMDQLSDRVGKDAVALIQSRLSSSDASALVKIHGAWLLHRLSSLPVGLLQQVAADPESSVRTHAMRVLSETPDWTSDHHALATKGLMDADALVRRCAADALGQHPQAEHIRPLLDALAAADRADTHLVHVLRMALRNQLLPPGSYEGLAAIELSDRDVQAIADVSLAVTTPDAAEFLLARVAQAGSDKETLARYLRHAVRYAASLNVEPLAALMRERFVEDLDFQLELLQSLRQGFEQRGQAIPDAAKQWGAALVAAALRDGVTHSPDWTSRSLDLSAPALTPWAFEERKCRDGRTALLLSSLPGGESSTSVLRSRPFACPSTLSFFLAGHNGPPGTNPPPRNVIRLRVVGSDEVIEEVHPPRNDVARKVNWSLSEHAGKHVYLEVVDGDTGTAYAWLAFGRLEPAVLPLPAIGPHVVQQRLRSVAELAAAMKPAGIESDLQRALLDAGHDTDTRAALADALAAVCAGGASAGDGVVPAMKQIVNDANEPLPLRDRVAQALGMMATPAAQQAIVDSFRLAPRELQSALAIALTSNTAAAETLLSAVADGKAPARLLLDLGIHDRLAAADVPDLESRVKQLTRGVAAPQEELEKLIADRRAAFAAAQPATDAGQAVFAQNCMACHQIDGQGGVVGPQLAGLSKRGIDRLIEDVLDPNRNVDPAFRYSTIILKDGQLVTGLQKREEGEVLVFADTTGKEVTVKKSDIKRRIESPSSLMPTNFAELIIGDDFNNLMAYLLSK